ncbi:hypothetical protein OBBRIDRAFT_604601 [Obba rivulosa]|uniref:Uncharacterized protein n=1 Tax=Obba rivulosa TaxID=1052685 RepID=A0A8E2AXZ9_9APHY|nr:hypothetical protein OBBRIDRAFT_604601 [Obba rivulosa]
MAGSEALPRSRSQPNIPRTASKRSFRSATVQRDLSTIAEFSQPLKRVRAMDSPSAREAQECPPQEHRELLRRPPPPLLAASKRSYTLQNLNSLALSFNATSTSRLRERQDRENIPPLPPLPPSMSELVKDKDRGIDKQLEDAICDARQTEALLSQERDAKKDILRALMTLQDEHKAQTQRLRQAEEEIRSFEVQLTSERNARAELNTCFDEERTELTRERDELKRERDELRTQMQETQAALTSAREEFELETELERSQRFRFEAMVQEQVESMVNETRVLEEELAKVQTEFDRVASEREALAQDRDGMALKYNAILVEREALASMCKAITVEFQAVEKENADLHAALISVRKSTPEPGIPTVQGATSPVTNYGCNEPSVDYVANPDMTLDTPSKRLSPGKVKGSIGFFGARRLDNMLWKKESKTSTKGCRSPS